MRSRNAEAEYQGLLTTCAKVGIYAVLFVGYPTGMSALSNDDSTKDKDSQYLRLACSIKMAGDGLRVEGTLVLNI